ncbi:MAG: hypothetical protein PHU25_07905 [Deltaproteobacteria bacterium]|nr:hypothetical protein [Deltaproteobacteria bacterium]
MVSEKMTKEMFEMFKSSVDTTWSTMSLLQNQAERMGRLMIDQFGTAQAEGRQRVEEWMVESKKKQEEFKKICDEGMRRFSEVVTPKD